MKKITLADCLGVRSVEGSALFLVSKVAFNYRRGHTSSWDGQNFWDFSSRLDRHIREIKRDLESGGYSFQPCLQLSRKIKLNKVRQLYIAPWRDKIVDRWLNDCLSRLLDGWYSPHSYAYRSDNMGVDRCQDAVAGAIRSMGNTAYVVKRDIRNYFYSIDHGALLSKLGELVDQGDPLMRLLRQRVQYSYVTPEDATPRTSAVGVPFGTSIACCLANINLTALDRQLETLIGRRGSYFRYADDFMVLSADPELASAAGSAIDEHLEAIGLQTKESHSTNQSLGAEPADGFAVAKEIKYLGLEFRARGGVRLALEKQRKIVAFFRRALGGLPRGLVGEERLLAAVGLVRDVLDNRIRSVAIVDYYLKHVNDENQLRIIDRLVAEMLISAVLRKKFRKSDFRTIPFGKLRALGLPSLVHRRRLHAHGHIRVSFMSLYNDLSARRYATMMDRRKEKINQVRLAKKLRSRPVVPRPGQTGEIRS